MKAETGASERGDADGGRSGDRREHGERDDARTTRQTHAAPVTYLSGARITYAAGAGSRGVVDGALVIDAVILQMLRQTMPDAEVQVWDMTGTMDHLEVFVRTKAFVGVSPLDRHRMVERALAPARADGRIHALQIRTATPEDTHG